MENEKLEPCRDPPLLLYVCAGFLRRAGGQEVARPAPPSLTPDRGRHLLSWCQVYKPG